MSQTPNPYVAPGNQPPSGKGPRTARRALQISEMFRWVFTNPNWTMGVLWGSLSLLLGSFVLPQMIFSGYLWDCMERLHKRETDSYPDFDTNRFSDYLQRGLWPFLVSLVVILPLIFILWAGMFLLIAIAGVVASQLGEVAGVVMVGVCILAFFMLVVLLNALLIPLLLRAGLGQDFGGSFDMSWIGDFTARMWKEMILGVTVIAGMGVLGWMVGFLLCCVGVYPALTIVMFAATHFQWQLYEMYLERGGTPIPLKSQMVYPTPSQLPPKQY